MNQNQLAETQKKDAALKEFETDQKELTKELEKCHEHIEEQNKCNAKKI